MPLRQAESLGEFNAPPATSGYCSSSGNTAVATACYVYDALGRRSVKIPASGVWTQYFYDLDNNVVSEFGDGCGPTCWAVGYVYFNGSLAAEYFNSKTYFVHPDHLGSTRLVTDLSTSVVQSLDYLPFGELNSSDTGITTHKFTGDERDSETNLDHTWFRQYSSNLGLWTTPDPAGLAAVDPFNPQSWNRYSYVFNNPTNLVDPFGLCTPNTICVTAWGYGGGDSRPVFPTTGSLFGGGAPGDINAEAQIFAHGGGNTIGFTLGIRAPGQSFNQCMVANAANYSAGGAFDLAAGTNIGNSTAGQILAGNTFTGIYSAVAGSAGDAATVAGTSTPDLLNSAIGTTTTFGRRTSNILALNLAGKGGLPQALSSSSGGFKSLLGSASKALNLGLDASLKAAGDLGLFGAEIVGCSIHR